MSKRELSEINAGSMADIAFLLLIFFLVTTTMNIDSGILRKIPKKQEASKIIIKNRNILEVSINRKNELFVDNQVLPINKLQQITIDFIDNGGGLDKNNQPCSWCQGNKNPKYSDHPSKAFISLQADRTTSYATYVSVLDQLNNAYSVLRNRLSLKMYGISYTELIINYKKQGMNKVSIEKKVKLIRKKYPLLISESEIGK